MNLGVLTVLGGVGLFLLGMVVLTEGLKGLAGNALRRILVGFTKTPLRGVAAGAAATAIVQSSSATTVTTVGFVGAGLLSFSQGLGIIYGANVGTTVTGWIVAIVGFRLDLGTVVLPLVFVGVLLRMFSRTNLRFVGWALAGFSLLFVGIDAMQAGMAPFEGMITPEILPPDTLSGRLQLVLLGALIVAVTQSSSAGVAAALVALSSGAISLPQGAAMIIGMNVGTTFTAMLASIGGSTSSRQTAVAHLIFNVITGVIAFALLGPFTALVDGWAMAQTPNAASTSLVAFHTAFNIMGVLLFLPFTSGFARLIEALVPERGSPLVQRLDQRLLKDPATAVDASVATINDIAVALFRVLRAQLVPSGGGRVNYRALEELGQALDTATRFIRRIRTDPRDEQNHWRHMSLLHAQDHLRRLLHRCGQTRRIYLIQGDELLRGHARELADLIRQDLEDDAIGDMVEPYDQLRSRMRRQRERYRQQMVGRAAEAGEDAEEALERLDSMRWLHRVSYHLWRIAHHLQRARQIAPPRPEVEEVDLEMSAE